MQENGDVKIVEKVVDAALKTGFGKLAESIIGNRLRPTVTSVMAEVVGTGSAAMGAAILRAILQLSDDTQVKLDRVMSNSLQTGCREAFRALPVASDLPGDIGERRARLRRADGELAKAYSFAEGQRQAPRQAYIALLRALIALDGQAPTFAALEFRQVLQCLANPIQNLRRQIATYRRQLYNTRNFVSVA